jgi:hypothetical protein
MLLAWLQAIRSSLNSMSLDIWGPALTEIQLLATGLKEVRAAEA